MELPATYDCADPEQADALSKVLRKRDARNKVWRIYCSSDLEASVAMVLPGEKLVCGEELFDVLMGVIEEHRETVRKIAENN